MFKKTALIWCLLFVALLIYSTLLILSYKITYIYDGSKYKTITTFSLEKPDIKLSLFRNGINFTINDEVTIKERNFFITEVNIDRAFPVKLIVDGTTTHMYLRSGTVGDILDHYSLKLGENDTINFNEDEILREGMQIQVNRVTFDEVVETTTLPFPSRRVLDYSIPAGKSVQVQTGVNGVEEKRSLQKFVNGVLVSEEVIFNDVTKKPVEAIIKYGDWSAETTRRGENLRYSRRLEVTATAYCLQSVGGHNKTASGKVVKKGFVAVDPKVIPMGSKLYIESPTGNIIYGYAYAEDTGGAIKGNKVDLFYDSLQEVKAFGRRKMVVYVIREGRE